MFIGRKQEMDFLNERYLSNNAEFITIYGRRRVGKTELITEFCKDKDFIFYACSECTDKKQFQKCTDTILSHNAEFYRNIKLFADWEDMFSRLPDLISDKKLIFVLDEFPYMVRGDKSIPSILQNLWDHVLSKTNIMIILSGSSVSFMEDEILSAKNPLYGRMTGIYHLDPLPFIDAIKFFPNYSDEDKVLAYSILGGIPHYLKQFSPDFSIEENIKKNILTKGSILFNEVEYILHQELREPAVYNTILEAIAAGCNKFSEICEKAMIQSSNLNAYLNNLKEIGLIAQEFPVLSSSKDKQKSSNGEYKIADNFFMFWYSFAYPFASDLLQDRVNIIYNAVIKNNLHIIASKSFEKISTDYLWRLNSAEMLPFTFVYIGRWWGKVTHKDTQPPYTTSEEIDILATDYNKKNYILGECKFRNELFDLSEYKRLKIKYPVQGNTQYYLFALSGFTDALIKESENDSSIHLIYLKDILKNS
ncbi:MAG: ATP-binding protein [Clostridia bacterium]|nr:ATP-binding protein [Clostridia bacterium]